MLLLIWECIINFIEIFLFCHYTDSILHISSKIHHVRYKQTFAFILIVSLECILNFTHISTFVIAILEIIYVLYFYQDRIFIRIFTASTFYAIIFLTEALIMSVMSLFHVDPEQLLAYGTLRILATALYLAMTAMIVLTIKYFFMQDAYFSRSEKFAYILIVLISSITQHFTFLLVFQAYQLHLSQSFIATLTISELVFIFLFLALLIYVHNLSVIKNKNLKLSEKEKIYALEQQEYKNLMQSTAALREMKHDMQIHLNVIQSLSAKQQFTELNDYIREYSDALNQVHNMPSTGNTALDCILSTKLNEAKQKDIQATYSVLLPQKLAIEPLQFSALLGNLWNNAIEACERISDESKVKAYIRFYIKPYQNMMIIYMENGYDKLLMSDDHKHFLSQKQGAGHGIGIKRINDIVHELNGIIQISTDNHIFAVKILFPQEKI